MIFVYFVLGLLFGRLEADCLDVLLFLGFLGFWGWFVEGTEVKKIVR